MPITTDCMVVNLQIGVWHGQRLDKEAAVKVIRSSKAKDKEAASVSKRLIPREVLRPVLTAASSTRTHFYENTLPWKANGDRLLLRSVYPDFVSLHKKLVRGFNKEVELFLDHNYYVVKERAEFRMGDLYKAGDFPPVEELKERFYVQLDIDAVTESTDFRAEMDEKHLAQIHRQMDRAMRERTARAMEDVWRRLSDALGHLATKLANKEEIFRNSTVLKLEEIVERLPDMNLTGDKNLERIRKDIVESLIGYDPNDLRKDMATRDIAAAEAQRIVDRMAGYMNAHGVTT